MQLYYLVYLTSILVNKGFKPLILRLLCQFLSFSIIISNYYVLIISYPLTMHQKIYRNRRFE